MKLISQIEAMKATVEEIKKNKDLPASRILSLEIALLEIEVMIRQHLQNENSLNTSYTGHNHATSAGRDA